MKQRWLAGLGWFFLGSTAVWAQTALTVDSDALWRVDLSTHEAELIAELGSGDPYFVCSHLSASTTGDLRCTRGDTLYEVRESGVTPIATLPTSSPRGLAFDSLDRLWLTGETDSMLWQLNPSTGAVVSTLPLDIVGQTTKAIAALGERLFVLTSGPYPELERLEEVDPSTGGTLSAIDLEPFGIYSPGDAAFDKAGDLWVSTFDVVISGCGVISYHRLHPSPFAHSLVGTALGCIGEPLFLDLVAVEIGASLVDVPAMGPVGAILLVVSLLSVGLWTLRR